ncbi:family 2 glycosyl transferase [Hyphomicrobium denitrificans 1NES1]|uniref:Family 2 glycosyl transferase n=1 Tax=Hyphomicrobium denitrificans 1NES1 TaxID=670307 RepID=N0BD14_9HYPH|nr:glycosyltransferase family 2 protein [Hyphomicrobium denitrificans]AGK58421.1 family 2 glycosyl transferase [Hyphomicrobium denitrificans 1NES1]
MRKLPLSCFIIAKNEADRIARTIRSVRSWVDEVVVVDSGSSDGTIAIARAEGARVIVQPWLGFGGQKRFAEEQCRHDWVLNLDADEVVPADLRREIITLLRSGAPANVAYGMPIHIVYPGQNKPRMWARDNWYARLYDRSVVRFRDSCVHDSVVTDGHSVGRLKAPIHHYSIRSFDHMRTKLDERMSLAAAHARPRNRSLTFARLLVEFPMNFYKYYIVRRHFTGGIMGLRYATVLSSFRVAKVYRCWMHRNPVRSVPLAIANHA